MYEILTKRIFNIKTKLNLNLYVNNFFLSKRTFIKSCLYDLDLKYFQLFLKDYFLLVGWFFFQIARECLFFVPFLGLFFSQKF